MLGASSSSGEQTQGAANAADSGASNSKITASSPVSFRVTSLQEITLIEISTPNSQGELDLP